MTIAPVSRSRRLSDAVRHIPAGSLTAEAAAHLTRLLVDLDAIGRIEHSSGRALVDEHTLRALLRGLMPREDADAIVDLLLAIPGKAVRQRTADAQALTEAGWVELSMAVPIFDADTEGFDCLRRLPVPATSQGMALAVNDLCRSLEVELLDPTILPPVLLELARSEARARLDVVLREVTRQLGWWAALTAVLLLALAAATDPPAPEGPAGRADPNVWPVGMLIYSTAIGGWTLTVVGNWVLASQAQ